VKRPLTKTAFALLLGWLILWGSTKPAGAVGIDESQRRLQEIESRIDRNYQELKGKENREKSLRKDLAAVAGEVSSLGKRIGREEKKAADLAASIKAKEEEIRQNKAFLQETEGRFREGLKVLYKE